MPEETVNDGGYAFARPAFAGISQRRLLAGIILGYAVQGVLNNPPKEDPTIETVRTMVRASIIFADELIKQTNE